MAIQVTELSDLRSLHTSNLNKAVSRNFDRFPVDFMFQLNPAEVNTLRSHFATSKKERGGRRYAPYAFTEHGAIMLAAVLNTPRATEPWSHKEEDNERKKRIKRCFPEDVLQIGFRGGSGYWG